jgi:hypothetical protein
MDKSQDQDNIWREVNTFITSHAENSNFLAVGHKANKN